jgi:hypothetical protein
MISSSMYLRIGCQFLALIVATHDNSLTGSGNFPEVFILSSFVSCPVIYYLNNVMSFHWISVSSKSSSFCACEICDYVGLIVRPFAVCSVYRIISSNSSSHLFSFTYEWTRFEENMRKDIADAVVCYIGGKKQRLCNSLKTQFGKENGKRTYNKCRMCVISSKRRI